MNKYALTLPLVILSFLLGYFGSNLKTEHFCLILVCVAIVVTIGVYLSVRISGNNKTKMTNLKQNYQKEE